MAWVKEVVESIDPAEEEVPNVHKPDYLMWEIIANQPPPVIIPEHVEIGAARFNARVERRMGAREYLEAEAKRDANAKKDDLDNDGHPRNNETRYPLRQTGIGQPSCIYGLPPLSVRTVRGEETFDEIARVKERHIFGTLARADKQDGQVELIGYA